jgi:hypothetical protein
MRWEVDIPKQICLYYNASHISSKSVNDELTVMIMP